MRSVIYYLLILALFASMGFGIYWQSQIVIRARYKFMPLIFSVLVGSWVLSNPVMDWTYVIMLSAFFTLNIMDGVGGIGTKRLVTNGLFSRVIDYANITALKMLPVTLPNGKTRVVAVFIINERQQIQMNFNQKLEVLLMTLKKLLPDSVQIEIEQLM